MSDKKLGIYPDGVDGPMLLASDLRLKSCGADLIGFDFLTTSGTTFAHGHVTIDTAKNIHMALGALIARATAPEQGN